MLRGICQVQLGALDLPRLAAFYRDVMGLAELPQPEGVSPDYWRCLQAGPVELALVAVHQAAGAEHPAFGTTRIVFRVADMEAAREVLAAKGLALGEVRAALPGVQVCDCLDPEGNQLLLESRD